MMFIRALILLWISTGYLLAGPEKFDPLSPYKKNQVKRKGPTQEKVISFQTNEVIASARYSYNDKNQLIESKYFLADKPNGKTLYEYNESGLHEEKTYDQEDNIMETIAYRLNKAGQILSYQVSKEKIKWRFRYRGGHLISGKRYNKGKLTESFIFKKRNKRYVLQELFAQKNKKIGSIKHFYKNGKLLKRIKKDNIGTRKAEYKYLKNGLLKEILLFETDNSGASRIMRKHLFLYSSENVSLAVDVSETIQH